MKRFIMWIAVSTMVMSVEAGVMMHLALDCRTGTRTCATEGEVLCYDASWYEGGAEARITDNGTAVTNGTAGSCTWDPATTSHALHTLKLEVLSAEGQVVGTETASFLDCGPHWKDGWKFEISEGEAIVIGASNAVGEVTLPEELGGCLVTVIGKSAFREEVELTSVTIPASVTNIGYFAFRDCLRLSEVKFLGLRPHVDLGAFMGVPAYAVVSSKTGSVSAVLPTEVNGDVVSVPNGWLDEIATRHKGDTPAGYSSYEEAFAAKYGTDLAKALVKPTGKHDVYGNAMMVWQDFVAGTDPLDEEDTFKATVTLVDGVPVVKWTPELTEAQAKLRSYKTYGKTALKDGNEWIDVTDRTAAERQELGYQFFKVSVEMK